MKNTENSNTKPDNVSAARCRYCAYPTLGATHRTASPPADPQAYEIKSCRRALCTGFTSYIPPPANRGSPGIMHVTFAKN
jgi:hypothetical protein